MKVVHLSTHDVRGGAARAMFRLHTGLRQLGISSQILARDRESNDIHVSEFVPSSALSHRILRRVRLVAMKLQLRSYRHMLARELFSGDRWIFSSDIVSQLPAHNVVNLHWISRFVDYGSFFNKIPRSTAVVWTLHDMNPFTGGCHQDDGCGRFIHSCGRCPKLGGQSERDPSRKTWLRKQRIWGQVDANRLHFVSPSRWLADRAKRSQLMERFRVSVIPNAVDTEIYTPQDRLAARVTLGISRTAHVALWASDSRSSPRKGFSLLQTAMRCLQGGPQFHLLCVGRGGVPISPEIPHIDLGTVVDEHMMAAVFNAADVHVVPSLQDNLPNTILESYACGTPVVANRAGGISEIVRSGETGELVDCTDADALAAAIQRVAAGSSSLSAACREIAISEYALSVQANRYVELYKEMKNHLD